MTGVVNGPNQGGGRSKPTIAQLGIDLGTLHWQRSGQGAGSFEVAFVGSADGSKPAGHPWPAGGRRPAGAMVAADPVVGQDANRLVNRVGYPAAASAQWILLRVAGDPAARVLVYDRIEWGSFVDGAAKGEFDAAAGLPTSVDVTFVRLLRTSECGTLRVASVISDQPEWSTAHTA